MSTTAFNLGLPTDIPWQRVCVSEDMLDDNICDREFVPKWHSSLAVFKYVPDEEYQTNDHYDLIYLKVSASLTGYQPKDKEIEGILDRDEMTVTEIDNVEGLLNEYHPCTGAIIQVMVQPSKSDNEKDPKKFPYFLDFEPKKRELYEMATDTKEKMSRSLQQLSVGKSGQSTQSLEVLDVDMGGSWNFGAEGSYAGTGGGIKAGGSSSGQWGTKEMNSHQTGVVRSTDNSNEKRETESFTTQLSQLYHLLDAYHVGTNRALFLMEPRPHVIAQESGFVRGPRPMDGIQEFFLVVAKPKNHKDICISVRLDSAHLAESDIMEYATRKDAIDLSTSAAPPAKNDPEAEFVGYEYMDVYFIGKIGERRYKCFEKQTEASENYIVADRYPDYKIDTSDSGGYTIESQHASRGGRDINVSSDGENLFAKVWARSHKCYNDGGTVCVDCPDTWKSYSANSSLNLSVNLISREPIRKVGTRKYLLVTTRGLCCCPGTSANLGQFDGLVAEIPLDRIIKEREFELMLNHDDVRSLSNYVIRSNGKFDPSVSLFQESTRTGLQMAKVKAGDADHDNSRGMLTPAQANALSGLIKQELKAQSSSIAHKQPVPYLASDFFNNKLETRLRQVSVTRRLRKKSLADLKLDKKIVAKLTKHFGAKANDVRPDDVVRIPVHELQRITGESLEVVTAMRLGLLGLKVRSKGDKEFPKDKPRKTPKLLDCDDCDL